MEEVGVLGHHTDGPAQGVQGDVAQVLPGDADAARRRVVQPRHQVRGGRLAHAGRAHQRGEFAGRRREADVAQHLGRFLGALVGGQRVRLQGRQGDLARLRVAEGHPVEGDLGGGAVVRRGQVGGVLPLGDQRLQVEQFEDPVEADHRGVRLALDAGQLGDRAVQAGQQGGQCHQRADLEGAVDDHGAAEAVDERGDHGGQQRHDDDRQPAQHHPGDTDLAHLLRALGEQPRLLARAAEELGEHRARHVEALADGRAHLGVHLHLFTGVAGQPPPDQRAGNHEDRQDHQRDQTDQP